MSIRVRKSLSVKIQYPEINTQQIKHGRKSVEVNSWQKKKSRTGNGLSECEAKSNDNICSVKVWNPAQCNLPTRKKIIRTWHGTTPLGILPPIRVYPRRRQNETRFWISKPVPGVEMVGSELGHTRHFAQRAKRGEEKNKALTTASPLFWLFRPPTPTSTTSFAGSLSPGNEVATSIDWRRWCQKDQSKHDPLLNNCHLSGYLKHQPQHKTS